MVAKLIKSTSSIAAMTFLSRLSGLLRDVVFANLLGDRAAADVFFVAFRIPNFFRRISGEGAFSAAFVPVFTDYRLHKTPLQGERFVQLMLGRFGLILLLASALGVLAAPVLVGVLAPGFLASPEKYQLAVDATRITFPYLFFISLVAMAAAMLNTCGRFAAPAATPILLNLCLIGAAVWLVTWWSAPIALAVGVLVAGVAQLLFQIPYLKREKLSIRPRLRSPTGDSDAKRGVGEVFRLTLPAIFGVSVAQINILVNTLLASFLVTGSISWLYYSDRLMEFPVGVFGIALGTAILPALSRRAAKGQGREFSATLDWALRWVFLVCVPATAGLIALSLPLVATIFFYGDFTANGVYQAAASLGAFACGLGAIVMVKILATGFYARKDTKTPVRIAVYAMLSNIVFALALVYPLRHVGLALATSLAAGLNAILLYRGLKKIAVYQPHAGWGGFLARVLAAGLVMGGLVAWLDAAWVGEAQWLNMLAWQRVFKLLALVATGALAYFAALYLLGIRLGELWRGIK